MGFSLLYRIGLELTETCMQNIATIYFFLIGKHFKHQ